MSYSSPVLSTFLRLNRVLEVIATEDVVSNSFSVPQLRKIPGLLGKSLRQPSCTNLWSQNSDFSEHLLIFKIIKKRRT